MWALSKYLSGLESPSRLKEAPYGLSLARPHCQYSRLGAIIKLNKSYLNTVLQYCDSGMAAFTPLLRRTHPLKLRNSFFWNNLFNICWLRGN